MLKTALAVVYLLSIPGVSAWAQVARVEALPNVSVAASAPAAIAAPAALPLGAAAPTLSAPAAAPLPLSAAAFAPAFAPAAALSASPAAVAAAPSAPSAAAVSAPAAEGAPAPSAAAPAAAPAEGRTVHGEIAYRVSRLLLGSIAALTGAVNSLPAAGPSLTDALIARAGSRRAVISDYDDTLAAFNERLPEDMVAAVQAIHAAGKTFDVISDRGDEKRGNTLTLFESLDTLPVATRAGMYVAANSGGRVYRYDETGTPVKVYEAPAMSEEVKARIAAAAEATKGRLAEAGTTQHDGVGKIPAESWGPYSYALMLKPGSSEDSVKATAAILQAELDRRGVDVEVNPRFAKDPANPPYVTLSLITKEGAARFIAAARGAGPQDVVLLGDSMYVPHAPKRESWLTRLGERASGRARPALGNRTDANMERGVPGALTLSVGTTGDPRAKNLFVLAGKGPALTRRVLESVAARPGAGSGDTLRRDALVAGLFIAAMIGGYALAIHTLVDLAAQWEGQLQNQGGSLGVDGAAALGGILGLRRAAKSAPSERPAPRKRISREAWEAAAGAVLLAAIVVGVVGLGTVAANWMTEGLMKMEQSLRSLSNDSSDPVDPGPPPNY